jgi:hypothetical protein
MPTLADIEGGLLRPLSALLSADAVPADLAPDAGGLLDRVFFADTALQAVQGGILGRVVLVLAEELVFAPFGDSAGLVIGGGGGLSVFEAEVRLEARPGGFLFEIALVEVPVALRVAADILRPLLLGTDTPDPAQATLDIPLGAVSLAFGTDRPVSVAWTGAPSVPRCMLGDSGIILSAGGIRWLTPDSEDLPAETPPDFLGLYLDDVTVELTGLDLGTAPALKLDYAFLGRGGITASIALENLTLAGTIAGFTFKLRRFGLTLVQNAITGSAIEGRITLPFFDEPLDVEAAITLEGGLALAVTSPDGLVTLERPGVLSLRLDGVGFAAGPGGRFEVALSGEIRPLVGGLDWPGFRVEALAIDQDGHVRLEGGWLDLRDQYALNLNGFTLEIARIGFGTAEDGRRWIGFSGGLRLVEGLTAGASVEGLRVLWNPAGGAPALTLSGVGVEFEVPGAVHFKGAVAMTEPSPGVTRFDGAITLKLIALELEVEAQLVVGYDRPKDYAFFAIHLGVELPAGIPLWSTGLGLYGAAGLFALQMEPDKRPVEAWYAIQPAPSWYHRGRVGVTDLTKWRNAKGALALGAGVTIGTVADNGFTFAGRFLLGISFPGPVLFIEGRANILKERASLGDEPIFRALVVLDARAGSFLVGLDARYAVGDDGELIEIAGGAEAFFDFRDAGAWHLWLGIDEPRERRIRAAIFSRLFEANAFLMLDARSLRTGAWIGWDVDWNFGPLRVALEAWLEGGATLSWKPVHLSGFLWLHGKLEISVFGFGFSLGADARIDAGVFDPFSIRAELSVTIGLPWPLPDIEVELVLQWGPELDPPLLPVPLQQVAVEHLKVTTAWPLPARGATVLLGPDIDADADGFFAGAVPAAPSDTAPPPPAAAPVVPLDARPRLTFGRSVHDDARIGVNPSPVAVGAAPEAGWEWVGDPAANRGAARIRVALAEVVLERWTGARWDAVARKGAAPNAAGLRDLYGSWAPVPGQSGDATANTKLWLWSRSPFDFTARTGGSWETWFGDTFPDNPCLPPVEEREVCCDFASLPPGPPPPSPWTCPDHPGLRIGWRAVPVPLVEDHGGTRALCVAPGAELLLGFDGAVRRVRLTLRAGGAPPEKDCTDLTGAKESRGGPERRFDGMTIRVFARDGTETGVDVRRWATSQGNLGGIAAGFRAELRLQAEASAVELLLTAFATPPKLTALGGDGRRIAATAMSGPRGTPEVVRLAARPDGPRIRSVVIEAPADELALHRACMERGAAAGVVATALDRAGRVLARMPERGGGIELDGRDLAAVSLSGGAFCLERVCWTTGPSAADRTMREEMLRHIRSEVRRWQGEGELLAPHTQYRLKITTTVEVRDFAHDAAFNTTRRIVQAAHFRTQGPPGLAALSVPVGHPLEGAAPPADAQHPPAFDSGLGDLTPYVAQTVPPTVPPPGEAPRLPRPVYRAYDTGLRFNEPYVEAMYALAGRDLSLVLFDANGEPARDAAGRLLATPNRWGRQETLTLSASEERWLRQLDGASCGLTVDRTTIPRDATLQGSGHLLDPGALYEARLMPLLLQERFDGIAPGTEARGTGAALGTWTVHDEGGDRGPSRWVVREDGAPPARFVEQTSDVSLGVALRGAPFPGGTLLLRGLAEGWTDYRLSVVLRSADDDVIGIGVRMRARAGYLLMLDAERQRRLLVRLCNGGGTVLAALAGGYARDNDLVLSLEARGNRLRAHLDGETLFDVTDAAFAGGGIALFCGANAGGRFAQIRVDDLRATAPVVFRYHFAASAFADIRHHLLAGRDETWKTALGAAVPAVAVAADPAAPPVPVPEAEAREAAALLAQLGPAARQPVALPEATRLGDAALLLRTAEPLDWSRTSLAVLRAPPEPWRPDPAGAVRILGAGFAAPGAPNEERVALLLREDASLDGLRIEHRTVRSATSPARADGTLLLEADLSVDAAEGPPTLTPLWDPPLQDLSDLTQLAVPRAAVPPAWRAAAGALYQDAAVRAPARPGQAMQPLEAQALGGDPAWTDIRLEVGLSARAAGGIGVLLRWTGISEHLLFEVDGLSNRRRLVLRRGGAERELWRDAAPLALGTEQRLVADADGSRIAISLDGVALAEVFDATLARGRVGFMTRGGPRARFSAPRVQAVRRVLAGWTLRDTGPVVVRSRWRIAAGALRQEAEVMPPGPAADTGGAVALLQSGSFADLRLEARIEAGAAEAGGVVLRWRGPGDHYRLVLDGPAGERRLVRVQNGVATRLWRDTGWAGGAGKLRIEAIGARLRGYWDGGVLFDLQDLSIPVGEAGVVALRGTGLAWRDIALRHAEPGWEHWFTVPSGAVPRLGSGSRVVVHAGRGTDPAPAPRAGERQLFAGAAAAGFVPCFPARGIDLRVVDAAGTPGHARRVLPDAAFKPMAEARVLRGADGTALAILRQDGAALPPGEYRLVFTFRRDNRARDPQSLVLSQAGETAEEVAVLDIPWATRP